MAQSVVNDSGFAGSSPHPSAEGDNSASPDSRASGTVTPTLEYVNEVDSPHCSAVERAMERLRVKVAAFSLERRIVAAAARDQWRAPADSLSSWAAGLLAERLRGLDERLETCRSELTALSAARRLLRRESMNLGAENHPDDLQDGLLGGEPDSLTMTSGDVGLAATPASRLQSHVVPQGGPPGSGVGSHNRVDAAVLLHLERRAHRETKKQLRELRKRHEVVKDELREAQAVKHIISDLEEPPMDCREICRLQAALLQLERVREELTSQNKALRVQLAEMSTKLATSNTPNKTHPDVTKSALGPPPLVSVEDNSRLRRKSTYKVVHAAKGGTTEDGTIAEELAQTQDRLAAAERALATREAENRAEVARLSAENARLLEDCNRERVARKRCHSQLQALRGKVRVFCRVRPPTVPQQEPVVAVGDLYTLSVFGKPGSPASLRNAPSPTPLTRDFSFDRVFPPSVNQLAVFEETSELLESVMDGYNVCICAYGQTGTGKTHTILGSPEEPGLAPRVFAKIFEMARDTEARAEVRISAYVLELYNDRLVDLLRPPDPSRDPAVERLEIRRDREGVVWVQGAAVVPVGDAEQLQVLFERALAARRTAATRLNASSSRSHLLIGVRVEVNNRLTGAVLRGKVSLLDLAGSERVSRSGAVDEQLREASSINKSLAALGDVVAALASDQPFVPYRNSKLTMLLQDSLGGNAKTLMFVTVSPDCADLDETVSSLTYATRVRQITNTTKRIADSREIARLKQIIERLKRGERLESGSPDLGGTDDRAVTS